MNPAAPASEATFQHVLNLWNDAEADELDPVERLIYRSNRLGSDQRITNTGGGNTSAKLIEHDPLTGEKVAVLWVKGSGGDLRTAARDGFSSLQQEKVLALRNFYAAQPERGPKTEAEDRMVGLYAHTTFNLNPRPSSIDTPLHAFIPYKHVDHLHPNAAIAVAACADAPTLTREVYGDNVIHTPWLRPGFELGLELQRICGEHPEAIGVVMGQHGLINWADGDRACYFRSLELIERAARYIEERYEAKGGDAKAFGGPLHEPLPEPVRAAVLGRLLPWLRGRAGVGRRMIATVDTNPATLRFINAHDAARLAELGTSCPDHFLRTKIKPLYVPLDPWGEPSTDPAWVGAFVERIKQALEVGLAQYREDYRAYYERCRRPSSPAMRDASPTVILIPGLGLVAFGKNKSESRVTAEFYNCAVEVMRGAEAISRYVALPEQESFDIEYWALEEAKLQRMPPEKDLDRQVVVIAGGTAALAQALAASVLREGGHVVLAGPHASVTAEALVARFGVGIGVAGTGISGCGAVIGVDSLDARQVFARAITAYGGVDHLIDLGETGDAAAWLGVAAEQWAEQGSGGSLLLLGADRAQRETQLARAADSLTPPLGVRVNVLDFNADASPKVLVDAALTLLGPRLATLSRQRLQL